MIRMAVTVVCILLLLAACGGGTGGSGVDPRLARLDTYEAQRARVLGDPGTGATGMPLTPDDAVPDAGLAVFSGAAAIQIEQPVGVLALAGDATLSIDFAARSATGTVGQVFGEGRGAGIVDYAGTLSLSGLVDAADFDLAYAGNLTGDGQTLEFAGNLSATLLDDPVAGFAAIDLEAQITQSGVIGAATLVIFGEGVVTPPAAVP